jgi:hypothetical protein
LPHKPILAASCFNYDVCSDASVEAVFTAMPSPSPGAASDGGGPACVEVPDGPSVVCALGVGQGNDGGGGGYCSCGKEFVYGKGCGVGTAGQAKLAQSVSSP